MTVTNNEWKWSPLAFRSRVKVFVMSGGGDGGGELVVVVLLLLLLLLVVVGHRQGLFEATLRLSN